MPLGLNEIARVVIRGEWITVERGSFRIEPFTLVDPSGNAMHPDLGVWAYRFMTDTRDEYYGPLSEIQLFKIAVI